MLTKYIWLALLASSTLPTIAQDLTPDKRVKSQTLSSEGTPLLITFKESTRYANSQSGQALREQLALTPSEELKSIKVESDELGFTHEKYQQYYRGVKVEFATYTVHSRGTAIESLSGHIRHIPQVNTTPRLQAKEALKYALSFVGAKQYMWQNPAEEEALKKRENNPIATYLPAGELVLVPATRNSEQSLKGGIILAWKFNIYATQPISRAYIYVDAQTGEVVLQDAILKHAIGPFATRYSGTRDVEAGNNPGGGFRLRDNTRGNGVETYNSLRTNAIGTASDFIDNDNNWTAAEYNNGNLDNAAGDAHFGLEAVYDYWRNVHNRNSFDNAGTTIRGYVHFWPNAGSSGSWDNAGWDGAQMLFGDGGSRYNPFTSLDLCAHEVGHAVCTSTANLAYQAESGALNEGFSDIWGAAIEQYTSARLGLNKNTWLIFEELVKSGAAERSMSDPKSLRQPAYYGGQFWVTDPGFYNLGNDFGGVHTNSGVLNHWFFILSQGKRGVNEGNNAYNVIGIGISAAAQIAFRAESVYMTSTTNYANARLFTIQAATDIYGAASCQVEAVTRAWAAVGVGPVLSYPSVAGPTQICSTSTAFFQLNNVANTAGVSWQATPSNLFTNTTGTGGQFTTSAASGASGIGTIQVTIPGACEPLFVSVQVGPYPATGKYLNDYQEQPLVASTYALDPNFVSGGQVQISIDAVPGTTNSFSLQSGQPHSLYQTSNTTATLYYSNNFNNADVYVTNSGGTCGSATTWFSFYRPISYSYTYSPNPTSDELTVQAQQTYANGRSAENATSAPVFQVELYNNNGLKVRAKESAQGKVVLNVRDLPSGLYNVRIGKGKEAISKHIEITR